MLLFTKMSLCGFGHRAGYNFGTADSSATFCVFAAHKVAAERALSADFAPGGHFNSFAQALVGLLFWHITVSFKRSYIQLSKKVKLILYAIRAVRSIRYLSKRVKKL
jgi:hypothetical protein